LASFFASSLRLTDLGRSLGTSVDTKHAIKRVDQLLRNPALKLDAQVVQEYFAGLLAADREPVLLVDWTNIGPLWTALVVTYEDSLSAGKWLPRSSRTRLALRLGF
jgi:hypothetical protein